MPSIIRLRTRVGMKSTSLCFVLAACVAAPLSAGDVMPSVTKHFAGEVSETPDFQKHVVPLLGRLGCNGRACHGSFKGQGGFRLSLFGYDFKNDHEQITGEDYSRIYVEEPDMSMMLMKPTLDEPHGGGKRLDAGSWQHKLLQRWIADGAQGRTDEALKLAQLQVSPSELIFDRAGEKVPLQAVAVWSDGTREDVTALCRFQSNNPTVAEVDSDGVITSSEPGDTHVVVFYDGGVVPVPVIRPVSDKIGSKYPAIATSTKIDELVISKLKKLGVVPSDTCTDAEYLRRVSLDLTGTLPTPAEVTSFLADSSPDKRARKVEELLETPAYAAWWATRLCDWTGNNPDFANIEIGRDQVATDWYDWIEKRVAENAPYDELVSGIVLSESREDGESFTDFCENMCKIYGEDGDAEFADRSMMPHYWARSNFRKAEDRAIGFAYTFMGIRIQCAQCHKHPFDQWTQDDFKNFEAFFTRVNYGTPRESKEEYDAMVSEIGGSKKGNQLRQQLGKMLRDGKPVPLREVYVLEPRNTNAGKGKKGKDKEDKKGYRNEPAAAGRVLGGETIDLNEYADPREPLMEWLRSADNPYFARSFVNRVWSNYFNVGIVNPPDDMSLANPPSNAPLLDFLAQGFIESGYDMKWLHREIIASDTYQRSWQPNETNRQDETNFSRAVHRRLPAEVAFDAVAFATASDSRVKEMQSDPSQRAIGVPGSGTRYRPRVGRTDASFALTVFGRSVRESNCDCDRSSEASLLQTVYLQNDGDVLKALDGGNNTWIGDVQKSLGETEKKKPADRDGEQMSPERLQQIRKRIAQIAREAAELRKNGKQKEAKALVAKVADLRRELAESERDVRGKKGRDETDREEAQSVHADVATEPAELVEQAYLRTLSRRPSETELHDALAYVSQAESVNEGVRDVLWALLNTKEFVINH